MEGLETTVAPGLKPSTSLQVGIRYCPKQAVRPRFPPAIPIKLLIWLLSEGPT